MIGYSDQVVYVLSWLAVLKLLQLSVWPVLRPLFGRLAYPAAYTTSLLLFLLGSFYLGLAHLPTWLISDYLVRGELLPLLCDNGLPPPEPSGIYALRLASGASSRSRLLLDFLQARFGPVPPWDLALQRGLKMD